MASVRMATYGGQPPPVLDAESDEAFDGPVASMAAQPQSTQGPGRFFLEDVVEAAFPSFVRLPGYLVGRATRNAGMIAADSVTAIGRLAGDVISPAIGRLADSVYDYFWDGVSHTPSPPQPTPADVGAAPETPGDPITNMNVITPGGYGLVARMSASGPQGATGPYAASTGGGAAFTSSHPPERPYSQSISAARHLARTSMPKYAPHRGRRDRRGVPIRATRGIRRVY